MTLKGARLLELLLSDFTWEGRQTFLENQSIDSLQQIAEEVPASLIRADGQHYPKDELIGIIQYGTRLNRILHTEVVLNKHTAIHRQLLAPISAEHPSIPDKVHSSRSKHMETTSLALQYLPSTSDALAMSPEVLAATSRPTQQSSQSHRRSNFPRLTSPTSSSYTPSPPLTKRRCFSPSPTPGALSSDNYEDFPVKQRKELLFSQLKSTAIQSNSSAVSVQTTFEANGKDSDPLTVKARSSEKFQRPRRATAGLGSYKQYRVEVDSDGEEYARSMSSGSESYGDDFVDEVCSEDELLQDEPYSDDALEVDDEDSSCNTSESDADSDEELHNYGRSRKITTSLSGATTSLPSDAARTTQSIARKRKRSTRRPVQAQPATHGFEQDLYEADSQGSFDDIMKRTIRQYVLPLASKNESIISAPLAALLQRPPTRLLHIIRSNTTQASREVLCQLNQGNIPSASLLSRLQEVKNMTLERSKGIYLHIGTPSEEDGGNDLKSSAVLVYIGSGLRDGSSPISAGLYKRCQEHSYKQFRSNHPSGHYNAFYGVPEQQRATNSLHPLFSSSKFYALTSWPYDADNDEILLQETVFILSSSSLTRQASERVSKSIKMPFPTVSFIGTNVRTGLEHHFLGGGEAASAAQRHRNRILAGSLAEFKTTWTHAGKDDRKYPALMLPQIKALTRQTVTIRTDFFEKIMAMNKDVFFAQEKVDRECWSKFSFPDGEVSKDAWVCTVRTSLPGGDVSFNITSTSWDVAKPNHLAKLTARVSDLDQAGVFYGQG